jgi:dolichol-phosphate mannosyltransferase
MSGRIHHALSRDDLALPEAWEVPEFTVDELRPRAVDYCIVIPVIDEGDRLLRQLAGMALAKLGVDVIVADGGSTDGSTSRENLLAKDVSALLVKTGPGRLSAQLRMGFAYALTRDYDGILTIDGNGKDDYEQVPRFVDALRQGFDFVQGSRYLPGGGAINTPRDREFAVRFIHAPLISLAAGFRYTDTTNGFRGFSAKFLRDPRVAPFREVFDSYNLHFYLSIRSARLGYRVTEIPVKRTYPVAGRTPTKISGLGGRFLILKQLGLAVLGTYDPKD